MISLLKDIHEQDTNNNSSNYANNGTSEKVYTDVFDEYKDTIKNDSEYTSLKKLADEEPQLIRDYAKDYCVAKERGLTDSEISNYLDEQAERIRNSLNGNDSTKRLLRKAENYSIELGKKYYC